MCLSSLCLGFVCSRSMGRGLGSRGVPPALYSRSSRARGARLRMRGFDGWGRHLRSGAAAAAKSTFRAHPPIEPARDHEAHHTIISIVYATTSSGRPAGFIPSSLSTALPGSSTSTPSCSASASPPRPPGRARRSGTASPARCGTTKLDTSITGNSNAGHEFDDGGGARVIGRKLNEEEWMDIFEFLKALRFEDKVPSSLAPPADWPQNPGGSSMSAGDALPNDGSAPAATPPASPPAAPTPTTTAPVRQQRHQGGRR